MNSFELGNYITNNKGLAKAVDLIPRIYTGEGVIGTSIYVGGALTPFVGPIASGVIAGGLAVVGVKQIYDGIKSIF